MKKLLKEEFVSQKTMEEIVWKNQKTEITAGDRSTYINKLRKQLDPNNSETIILVTRDVGYSLAFRIHDGKN
jgi:DNA-binding response OmpR family regulator